MKKLRHLPPIPILMSMDKLLIFLLLASPLKSIFAAPIPGTSSSELFAPKIGVHHSKYGFMIDGVSSNWLQTQPPKKSRYIETVYRSPEVKNETRATLTVRVDRLKKSLKLKNYVKRWVKEYPKYGYDVLGSKKFKSKGRRGYVIDLINSKKRRQLRQVIYLKNQTAVLMTCRDHVRSFKKSLRGCNKIVKSFTWVK